MRYMRCAMPSLLTGWFGKNFRHMPELDQP